MKMPKLLARVLVLSLSVMLIQPVYAGEYVDKMSRCLVDSTSKQDKTQLVRWMFAAISLNPDVKPLVKMTDKDRDRYNKIFADLIMRLLSDSCKTETQAAIQHEGRVAIPSSFRVLGAVAAKGLMSNGSVQTYMSGIQKYIDVEKLKKVIGGDSRKK